MPKSLSLLTKFPSRSMFVGLMSPCATALGLLLCRNESAEQISEMMSVLASHDRGGAPALPSGWSSKLPFGMNSYTRAGTSGQAQIRVTRYGCLTVLRMDTCKRKLASQLRF
jgi:hypothetical protein